MDGHVAWNLTASESLNRLGGVLNCPRISAVLASTVDECQCCVQLQRCLSNIVSFDWAILK